MRGLQETEKQYYHYRRHHHLVIFWSIGEVIMLHITPLMRWHIHIITFFHKQRTICSIIDIGLFSSPWLVSRATRKKWNVSFKVAMIVVIDAFPIDCAVSPTNPNKDEELTWRRSHWQKEFIFHPPWDAPNRSKVISPTMSKFVMFSGERTDGLPPRKLGVIGMIERNLVVVVSRSTYTVSPTILNKGKELT